MSEKPIPVPAQRVVQMNVCEFESSQPSHPVR
jgi:hypothetical protein